MRSSGDRVMQATPTSRYFEESERYVREYELKNGMGREYVDQERRTQGIPFRSHLNPEYRTGRQSDWPEQRQLNNDNGAHSARPTYPRQSSVPPIVRRLPYNVSPATQQKRSPPSYASYAANTEPYSNRYNSYGQSPPQPLTVNPSFDPSFRADDRSRQFLPRSYFDSCERRQPLDRGSHLESSQSFAPISTYGQQPASYTSLQYQTASSLQYPSRPGSPQQVVGVGDILNTETGFTIQLDVKHFNAKDIRVVLCGNTLTVAGERVDEDLITEQTLKRTIPADVLLDSIKAHLTDFGLLLIRGNRKNWKETEIVITIEQPQSEAKQEVQKNEDKTNNSNRQSPLNHEQKNEEATATIVVAEPAVIVQPTKDNQLHRSKEMVSTPLLVRPVVSFQTLPTKRGSRSSPPVIV
ncbi:SHSP domain-containing protein [Aphelenchoides besseyi]|nr:SHSP domain-containing protein [Aphelenchoides besseyi]KAI6194489.1 SHSP domain-containing protein [Aphelenchoides besseyi]